jgi:hypothetical protein
MSWAQSAAPTVFVKAKEMPEKAVKCSRNDAGIPKLCQLSAIDFGLLIEKEFYAV